MDLEVLVMRWTASYAMDDLFLNPQKMVRKSKDASNLYYILMDRLPSYREYPSRSKSIIFSNKKNDAEDYASDVNDGMIDRQKYQNFINVYGFYLRVRIEDTVIIKENDYDPWHRKFIKHTMMGSVYKYYSFPSSTQSYMNLYIIVTTVNKKPVYCVDVIKLNK